MYRYNFTLILLLFSGCASLSKQQCLQGQWDIIGYQDGANGKAYQYLNEHSKACGEYGIRPDVSTYQRGRERGLVTYCTESNGYSIGNAVSDYNEVCPQHRREPFIQGYLRGLDDALDQLESDSLRTNQNLIEKSLEFSRFNLRPNNELKTIDENLRQKLSGENHLQQQKKLHDELDALEHELNDLQQKRQKIRNLKRQYQ